MIKLYINGETAIGWSWTILLIRKSIFLADIYKVKPGNPRKWAFPAGKMIALDEQIFLVDEDAAGNLILDTIILDDRTLSVRMGAPGLIRSNLKI